MTIFRIQNAFELLGNEWGEIPFNLSLDAAREKLQPNRFIFFSSHINAVRSPPVQRRYQLKDSGLLNVLAICYIFLINLTHATIIYLL